MFWFPQNEEQKYYGYLKFDYVNGITLEIFDNENLMKREVSYINIFGVLEDKKKITLNKCSFISAGHFLEFPTSKFSIIFLLVGKHFDNIPIHFENCIIEYSSLHSFITIDSLENLDAKGNTISYKRELNIPSYCKIKFYSENNKSSGKLLVMIKSLQSKSLDYYIELKHIIQDFLNLVISDYVFVKSFFARIPDQYEKIEIIYNSQRSAENTNNMMFKPHVITTLFQYKQVEHQFENILAKWFEIYEQLRDIYNLYFGVIYNPQLYDVMMFLMLAEALENYHLKVKDNNSLYKITKKTYIKDLKKLVEKSNFNDFDKQYLIKGLSNITSLSREERYTELYRYYYKILIKIRSIKDQKRFLSLVVKTRNYYTHYKEDPNLIAKGDELIWIIKDLQCFLQLCFLSYMNFSLKEIETFYKIDKL